MMTKKEKETTASIDISWCPRCQSFHQGAPACREITKAGLLDHGSLPLSELARRAKSGSRIPSAVDELVRRATLPPFSVEEKTLIATLVADQITAHREGSEADYEAGRIDRGRHEWNLAHAEALCRVSARLLYMLAQTETVKGAGV